MPEHEEVAIAEAPTEGQVNQLIWADQGVEGKGLPRTWRTPTTDKVVLTSDDTGINVSKDDGTTAPTPVIVEGTEAGGALDGVYPNPSLDVVTVDALIPPGTIWAFGGVSPPGGWYACDGSAVSRTTEARLFAAIGTAWGAGDGSTTFNLPNLFGRVVLGFSGTHAVGSTGGAEAVPGPVHTHPGSHSHGDPHTHPGSHSHGLNSHTHGIGAHQHTTPLAHDHMAAHPTSTDLVAAAAPSALAQPLGGGIETVSKNHWHAFDTPALPATNGTSSVPTASPTVGPTPTSSEADANVFAASPATTQTDATVFAASYPTTLNVMNPYGVALWIIRAGA